SAGGLGAVMAFQAYRTLPPGKTDALFLHVGQYMPEQQEVCAAVPFRTPTSRAGFAVFRPKFIAYEDAPPPLGALEAFLRGVTLYPPGDAIWRQHLDESR